MKKKYKIIIPVSLSIIAIAVGTTIYFKKNQYAENKCQTHNKCVTFNNDVGAKLSSKTSFDSMITADASSNALISAEYSVEGFNRDGYNKQGYTRNIQNVVISYDNVEKEIHNEKIEKIDSNPIKLVSNEPISTFSSDVDDGSYRLFYKNAINSGYLIPKNSIRVEEFINAFNYDYERPDNQLLPFTTDIKVSKSPWSDNYLMKIGVKGFKYDLDNLPNVNLVFLIDISGSMRGQMPIIKESLKMLVNKLRPDDKISLVTYAGSTSVVLKNTPISDIDEILSKIDSLSSGGSTNGQAGITLAYKEAESGFIKDGVNRILLVSDGDFNVGINNTEKLKELIKEKRKSNITFSTIGIGGGNFRDDMMEKMANVGNGAYTFIGDMNDARRVFADRFISTLKNIAKDVKYQVEFNPNNVKEYRLLGYENRMLKTEDFNNDKVDAGEIPSDVSTTAIYEITLADQEGMYPKSRYQDKKVDDNNLSNELAFVKIRFKQPNADKSQLLQFPVDKSLISNSMDENFKLASAVAGFTQIYSDSKYISNSYSYDDVLTSIEDIKLNEDIVEFKKLVKVVESLEDSKN